MTTLTALAGNTIRELTRNKLLYILVVFALLLISSSVLLAQLTIGQWERIINNVGLATVQISGALVAILVGVGLVAGEVDRRTLYVTLAKPVSRAQFIVGRYLGLVANLGLIVLVMGGALWTVLKVTDYPMGMTGLSALLLIFVELCVLAAFAVVFSSFTTQTLGVMFSLCIFVIGHLTSDLALFAERMEGGARTAVLWLVKVLPNLDLLNLKTQAANNLPVEPTFVLTSAAYGFGYAALAVAFAAFLFTKRDLK